MSAIVAERVPARRASAAPLALLHGFLGRPTMWRGVLAAMPSHGEAVLPVLPGHGPSPWYSAPADFAGAAAAIAADLGDGEPRWLVGYSLGARLALGVLAHRPERVRGLVLVGVDPGLRDANARQERAAWDDAQARHLRERGLEQFVDAWESLPLFATQRALPAPVRAARRGERLEHTVDGLAWALAATGLGRMPEHWSTLASTARPVLIVTGARDDKFTALGRQITAHAPRAQHRVAPDVGHDVALEAPAFLARAIAAVIDAHELAA